MKRFSLLLALFFSLSVSPAWPADFALVQQALNTSTGTQDFTSTGFGTPKCVLFWATYGTANGTTVNHAMLAVGATDGTRSRSLAVSSGNALADSDTGMKGSATAAFVTISATAQAIDGSADFNAWVTDGVQLNVTDAFPSAYLLNVLLIGGSGVSNCYVGNASTPTVVNTATDVTALGFQPDVVFTWGNTSTSLTSDASSQPSLGIVVNDGSNTQRGASFVDGDAAPSMAVGGYFTTTGLSHAVSGSREHQIQGFDANGFDLFLRGANGTLVATNYLAIKLNGIAATLLTSASPTGTGDHTITGAGFPPQFGMMLQGEYAAVNTNYTTDDSEVYGLSAFTAAGSLSASMYCEDSNGTSATESLTDTKPVNLRKDNAAFMTATLSAFTSDGVTFNYSVVPGAATQRAVLFVGAPAGAGAPARRRAF